MQGAQGGTGRLWALPAAADAGRPAAAPVPPCVQLSSLDDLAALQQTDVQACCRLTSATLQTACWDACNPPPSVSQEVIVSLGG